MDNSLVVSLVLRYFDAFKHTEEAFIQVSKPKLQTRDVDNRTSNLDRHLARCLCTGTIYSRNVPVDVTSKVLNRRNALLMQRFVD